MIQRGLTDLIGEALDRFARSWKPLALGFGLANVAGAVPMWLFDVVQGYLYSAATESQGDFARALSRQLPSLALGAGLVLAAVVAFVMAYNFAFALAQVTLRSERPEDVRALCAEAGSEFLPAMRTLTAFSLIFLVPAALFGLAIARAASAFASSGGWGSALLLVAFGLATAMLSVPVFLLAIAVPSATGVQGMPAFTRALAFAGENALELFLVAGTLVFAAMVFGIFSTVLQAPFPAGDGGLAFKDLMDITPDQLLQKLLEPEQVPLWSRIGKIAVDTLVYVAREGFSVCFVAVWFSARSRPRQDRP